MKKIILFTASLVLILSCGIMNSATEIPASNPSVGQENTNTPSSGQGNANTNTSSNVFDIIPYDVKEKDSTKPGYKLVDVYFMIENVSADWAFFNHIIEATLKTQEGYSTQGSIYDNMLLLPPGIHATSANIPSCPDANLNSVFCIEFQIGATLHPSSMELKYGYQPIDNHGGTYNSPYIDSDIINFDLRHLSKKNGVPFSKNISFTSLPISYTTPTGTLTLTSAKIKPDSETVDLSVSVKSADPAKNNYAGLTASILTEDGVVGTGNFLKGTLGVWGVGPLQTVDDTLEFNIYGGGSYIATVPWHKPIYLLFWGFYIGDDVQVVKQIIKLSP